MAFAKLDIATLAVRQLALHVDVKQPVVAVDFWAADATLTLLVDVNQLAVLADVLLHLAVAVPLLAVTVAVLPVLAVAVNQLAVADA